jgi:hypothetical protein
MTLRNASLLAVFFAAAFGALAQEPDPPSRVARLNYLAGSVSFRPGTVEEWSAASLNYPLTIGDHLWTDPGARTEMHMGSTAIRMGSQTALAFLNLDDRAVQLSLTQGSMQIRVSELPGDESYEVDTPNVAITILRAGSYRIDADGQSNTTIVTVLAGDVSVTGGGVAIPIHAREAARLAGVEQVSYEMSGLPQADEFDGWCDGRDRAEQNVQSTRYVPASMTGYEDLDRYGTWRDEPGYGSVWMPAGMGPGWAPYRYGHWVWIEPWGWTWVDDAPWGFAPFHYGRWAMVAGGWGWVPGPRPVMRPVYAPALVVFVGGAHFGGSAVWFPLGPREAFRPQYRVSNVYYQNLNGPSYVAAARYSNQGIAGAVTAVRVSDFASGRSVTRVSINVDVREVGRAPVAGFAAPVRPVRESRLAGPVRPAPRVVEREVVVRTAPPAPRGFNGGAAPRAPMVRMAPPARQMPSAGSYSPQNGGRDDRSRRFGDSSAPAQPGRFEQPNAPRVNDRPGQSYPQGRSEQPRQVEQPRNVQPQRPAEPARRVEPQHTEAAPAVHRQENQPKRDERHEQRRTDRREDKKQQ